MLTGKKKKYVIWDNTEEEPEEDLCDLAMDFSGNTALEGRTIVRLSEMGLWNGIAYAVGIVSKEGDISACFRTECDYASWYVDMNDDLRCDAIHHDGMNHYLYRAIRKNISRTQRETFIEKFIHGKATARDISRYTEKIGPALCE